MLGRDWFSMLKLNRAAVNKVDRDDFLEPYQALFSEGLGTLKRVTTSTTSKTTLL